MPQVGGNNREGRKGQNVALLEDARQRRADREDQAPVNEITDRPAPAASGFQLSDLELAAGLDTQGEDTLRTADEVLREHQQAAESAETRETQLRDQAKRTPTADEIFAGLSLPRETERQDHSPRGSADLKPISRRDGDGRFKAAGRESTKPRVRSRLLICAAVSVALIAVIAIAGVLGNSPTPTGKSKASVAAAYLGESPKPTTRTAPRGDAEPRRQSTREPKHARRRPVEHATHKRVTSRNGQATGAHVSPPSSQATSSTPNASDLSSSGKAAGSSTAGEGNSLATRPATTSSSAGSSQQSQSSSAQPAFGANGSLGPGSSPDS